MASNTRGYKKATSGCNGIIEYHMHVQYHKKHLFEKEKKLFQVTVKQSTVFFYE